MRARARVASPGKGPLLIAPLTSPLYRNTLSGWMYEGAKTRRIDTVPEVKELFQKHPKWNVTEFSRRCHLNEHFYEQGCLEFLYDDFPEYRGMYKVGRVRDTLQPRVHRLFPRLCCRRADPHPTTPRRFTSAAGALFLSQHHLAGPVDKVLQVGAAHAARLLPPHAHPQGAHALVPGGPQGPRLVLVARRAPARRSRRPAPDDEKGAGGCGGRSGRGGRGGRGGGSAPTGAGREAGPRTIRDNACIQATEPYTCRPTLPKSHSHPKDTINVYWLELN